MRDGIVRTEGLNEGVMPGDVVMMLTTADAVATLDRLFGVRKSRAKAKDAGMVDFVLEASAGAASVADIYGLAFEPEERPLTLEEFMRSRLGKDIKEGARARVGGVELVAMQVSEGVVHQIGLDLDPPPLETTLTTLRARLAETLRFLREQFIADGSRS